MTMISNFCCLEYRFKAGSGFFLSYKYVPINAYFMFLFLVVLNITGVKFTQSILENILMAIVYMENSCCFCVVARPYTQSRCGPRLETRQWKAFFTVETTSCEPSCEPKQSANKSARFAYLIKNGLRSIYLQRLTLIHSTSFSRTEYNYPTQTDFSRAVIEKNGALRSRTQSSALSRQSF